MSKIIDFYGSWCSPCRAYKPTFEKVSKMDEFGDIEFEELDVDENEDLAAEYEIRGVPATIFLNNKGEIVDRLAGLQTEDVLIRKIREAFPKN